MVGLLKGLRAAVCWGGCLGAGTAGADDLQSAIDLEGEEGVDWRRLRPGVRWARSEDPMLPGKAGEKGGDARRSGAEEMRLGRRGYVSWDEGAPRSCLIVRRPKSDEASQAVADIGLWLRERGITVVAEKGALAELPPEFEVFEPRGRPVDLCVTVGGDGTVLHLASLFEEDEPLPPVVGFALGGLGFLTPFHVRDFEKQLARVLAADRQGVGCTLRCRKRCEVYTGGGRRMSVHHALNECIVDRGASASTITVELFADGRYVTTVTADGLVAATPSGSTAYSLAAGGPMVAPSVPCTVITPVAPLSLSFRPLVVPEGSEIIIHVADNSRSMARASFDGRHQTRLVRGSSVKISNSMCPLPLVGVGELDADWFEGVAQKMKWHRGTAEVPRTLRNGEGPAAAKGEEGEEGEEQKATARGSESARSLGKVAARGSESARSLGKVAARGSESARNLGKVAARGSESARSPGKVAARGSESARSLGK
ncbi:unnamed protein product [Ostreobium quekettii]|uniref:Uncharacterized protein n=1 Tax=Ostreobium quekettii TaxID=121088 RepID=A0A8S1IQQ5_9CHLO|nr:unnamed protein product [Ostreobium quekettii]|eukprot:evm.model.scf_29.3 EVM.evm.TU.scf_29.3   scf_29:23971-25422(+)